MRLPSIKTLEAHFQGKGTALRRVLEWHKGAAERFEKLYPQFKEWTDKCHYYPRRRNCQLFLLNLILEGHGIEEVQTSGTFGTPEMEYVNMGESYAATIIFDHGRNTWFVEGWADWVEKAERRGLKFD